MRPVILMAFFSLYICSCWWQAKNPKLSLDSSYRYIESKSGIAIKSVSLRQEDINGNFIAQKTISKSIDSKGLDKVFLFVPNNGYDYYFLDTPFLARGYKYTVMVQTRGFEDTIIFNIQ